MTISKQKLHPCLWFDRQAEDAAKYYTSIFKNSSMGAVSRYNEEGAKASGLPVGTAMTAMFVIEGQQFMALNGGPIFKFTEAVSFVVNCDNQEEIDHLWNKLTSDGGQESMCGWLKDKFGLSWQIIPANIGLLMQGMRAKEVMHAMLQMRKLDIAKLEQAAKG